MSILPRERSAESGVFRGCLQTLYPYEKGKYNVNRWMMIILTAALMVSHAGCVRTQNASIDINSIRTYQDIPGVTSEEIAAIEALKDTYGQFSYGQMEETEAFILPDGTYDGFAARFCKLLSRLFGIEFALELHEWDALKSDIDNMRIDFTGDLTPTPERIQQYYMTHPTAERSLRVFQYMESNEILLEKDIIGLKVGSLTGTIDIDHVKDYYPELIFTVVDVNSFDAAAQMLKSGEIDVFITEGVVDPLFDKYGFIKSKELFSLVYTPVSLTTANPELKPVIDVVNKYLTAGGIDILFDLYKAGNNAYSRYKLSKSFTEEERAYLHELTERNTPVKIALEYDNYPISFYNTTEREFQGIAIDVLSEISELLGISYEVVNDEHTSWAEILRMLRSGETSLVSQLLYSDERKGSFLWQERPYASAYYALISKSEYPNMASYQVVRATVGTITGSAYEDKYHEWFPGNENLIRYEGQNEVLDALDDGEVDLLMGSNYLLLMQQNYRERPGLKINIRFSAPMDSYFGFHINETILCSLFSKAQSFVNTSVISDEWTNRGYDYTKKMAQQRSLYLLVIASALFVILALMIFFLIKNKKNNFMLDRTVNDMTRELRVSVAKLQAVISNYSGVIWSVDRDNTITLFDGLYLKEIGVTPDFLEGKKLDVARLKNRHLDILEHVEICFAERITQDWMSEIDNKMFRSRIAPIFDGEGRVAGVVGNIDDITESIRLQNELTIALGKAGEAIHAVKSAQLTVSAMFESNPQINVLFSDTFKAIDCNPAAYKFMGFNSKEELLNGFIDRMASCIPKFQSDGKRSISINKKLVTATKEGFATFETEMNIDGATRILSVDLKRIPYENSFAIVAYVFNMTEIREREKELITRDRQLLEAVEEARAANQAKSAFLSNMSHEIRTPMNAILGITEIQFQNELLEPSARDAFDKIYTSGDMLLGIINDILDLSKIEAGKLELAVDNYETASLINDTAQLNMMRIGSKPIEFELDVDESMPSVLIGDELRVKQILNNVLSNAFKYTAEGMVKLSVSCEPGEGGEAPGGTIVFKVSDTGQGMTTKQISMLFDKYSRFNQQANRTTEGTGLGMNITQNLIRLMNGKIDVESEPGKGSVFTVRIPQGIVGSRVLGRDLAENLRLFRMNSEEKMKRVQITRDPMPYGKVLIVDDVETNIYVAKGLLAPYGLKVDSAESGFEAINIIKEGGMYDIVFMDHMMPKMDGIEATKIIRDIGYKAPIVALTANALAGQAEIFFENGFDDFISKPIDIRQLNNVLNKLIRDKQTPEVLEAARRKAGDKNGQSVKTAPAIDPRFVEIFVRDASKVLVVLDGICAKQGVYGEDDMRMCIINVHGIKSALASVGQMELSAFASKLEQAGRDGDTDKITSELPAFISSLRALVEVLLPKAENDNDETTDDDGAFLLEKLLAVKAACEQYDEDTADAALAELKGKKWPQVTKELLNNVSMHLLHSNFDEIVGIVDDFRLTTRHDY